MARSNAKLIADFNDDYINIKELVGKGQIEGACQYVEGMCEDLNCTVWTQDEWNALPKKWQKIWREITRGLEWACSEENDDAWENGPIEYLPDIPTLK